MLELIKTIENAQEFINNYINFYLENDDELTLLHEKEFRLIQNTPDIMNRYAKQLLNYAANTNDIDYSDINNYIYNLLRIKIYNIKKYLGLINLNDKVDKNKITDYEILSETLNDLTDGNLWAYSIEELDYCIQENKNICIVNLTNGNKALAELPEEML